MASHPRTSIQTPPRRIIKLGGSLLDLPHLGDRLQNWLAGEPQKLTLLVTGGGDLVEAMRRWDAIHIFATDWCHWKCIELMDFTASIASSLLPGWVLIDTPSELDRHLNGEQAGRTAIVSPKAYFTPEMARQVSEGNRLPENWKTTSDSMAAFLAHCVAADELVLLKSVAPERFLIPSQLESRQPNATMDHRLDHEKERSNDIIVWQQAGLVDDFFPQAALGIHSVRIVNLRS